MLAVSPALRLPDAATSAALHGLFRSQQPCERKDAMSREHTCKEFQKHADRDEIATRLRTALHGWFRGVKPEAAVIEIAAAAGCTERAAWGWWQGDGHAIGSVFLARLGRQFGPGFVNYVLNVTPAEGPE